MKKKTILVAAIAVMLVAALVVGGTLAYFTDTKTADNVFTVGNVAITLDETDVNDPDGERVTSNEYTGVLPGIQYKKDPVVTNTGNTDAYVRAVVTVENGLNWLGLYKNRNPNESAFEELICNTLGEGWEIEDFELVLANQDHTTSDAVVTLKYNGALKAGEATSAMFDKVMLPTNATADDIARRVAQNGVFHIDVVAQAIQVDGFDTWEVAFAAFDAQK